DSVRASESDGAGRCRLRRGRGGVCLAYGQAEVGAAGGAVVVAVGVAEVEVEGVGADLVRDADQPQGGVAPAVGVEGEAAHRRLAGAQGWRARRRGFGVLAVEVATGRT